MQTGGSSGPVSEIVTLSALQPVGINGSNVLVTIPLVQQSVAAANVTTTNGASCQNGFDCVSFTAVPDADDSPVCGQTEVKSNSVTVIPGSSSPVGTLSFTSCS